MEGFGLSGLGLDRSVQSRKSAALASLSEDHMGWGVCFWEVGENAYSLRNPDYLAVSLLSGACQISVQDIWISVQDPCRLHNHTN